MAGEIEIGEGYVKVTTRVDDKAIGDAAERSGENFEDKFTGAVESRARSNQGRLAAVWRRTGAATSDGFYKGADGRWRDGENRFVASADVTGTRFGTRMVKGVLGGLGGLVSGVTGVFTGVRGAIGPLLGSLGALAPAISLIGPAIGTAGTALWNFGSAAVAAAPAIALMYGQVKVAQAIITSFGPAIGKALKPVEEGFMAAHEEASALATRGLTPLAERFVDLNMPAISTMLNRIATATNGVITGFGEWANSAAGVGAIENITRGIADLVEAIAPDVRDTGIAFLEMLSRISDVSTAAGITGLSGILGKVREMLDSITAASVQDGLTRLGTYFGNIRDAVVKTIEVGTAIWDFYTRFRTEIQLTVDALGILAIIFGGPVTAAVAAAGLIIRHWDQVKVLFQRAREWFSGIEGGSDIMDRLKTIANDTWTALQRAFFTIRDAVEGPLRELGEVLQGQLFPAFGNLLTAIGPLIPVLIDQLAPAIGRIVGGFIEVITFVAKVVAAVINFGIKVGQKADEVKKKFDSVVTFFRELPGRIRSGIANLPSIIGNVLSTAANRAAFLVGQLIGTAIRLFLAFPGKVRSAISAAPGVIGSVLTTAKNRAVSGATSLVNGTVSFLKTLPGKARSALSSLPGRIKGVFSGAANWLVSAGRDVLRGLVNGIRSQIGATVNAVKGVGGSVIGGLKSGLGINSPSILAEREVGKWVLPGVTRGIKRTLPVETRKIATMAPAMATAAVRGRATTTAAATKAKATTAATTSRIENLNVNIRGVLDPSDPVALRRMIAQIYEELAKYERSFA